MVLTSTSEVYGTAQTVPIDERHPFQGQSPYAATKIGADALGESYFRAFGLPVTILRPFNTFGPRQSARAIIPTIISQALARPNVRLGRLDPRRDLTYVKDTVAGFVAIAGCDAALGRAVNIGRGEDISIGDLVEIDRPPAGPIDRRRDRSGTIPARRERGRAPARRHGPGAKSLGLEAQILARGRARRDDRLGARPSRPVPGRVVHDLTRRRCQRDRRPATLNESGMTLAGPRTGLNMTIDWTPLADLIETHDRFLVTTHVRPDGDALGSEVGMAGLLRQKGKDVRVVNSSPTPPRYDFLDPDSNFFEHFGHRVQPAELADREVAVILDLSSWNQLGDMAGFIRQFAGPAWSSTTT